MAQATGMRITKPDVRRYERESPTAALAAEITDTILARSEWKRDDIRNYIVGCLNSNEFHGNLDKVIAEIRSNRSTGMKKTVCKPS